MVHPKKFLASVGSLRLTPINSVILKTQLSFQASLASIRADMVELSACQKVQMDRQMETDGQMAFSFIYVHIRLLAQVTYNQVQPL